jgi:SAM-dependent methyltransferase
MHVVLMLAIAALPATALFDSQFDGFVVELLAQDRQQPQEKPFVPVSGQAGKDVVWVPSPPEMVNKMLEVAKVTPADYVIDLGSGDGRNVIAAAKLGANALGVEYNPDMVALSQRLAKEAGVENKAKFVQGDMYEADISKATVMALFLLPVNLNKLAPKFLDLKPGSRIVLNTFGIDGWEPDYRTSLPQGSECESWCDIMLLIVPAKVAGTWNLSNGGRLELTQSYQTAAGTLTINGQKHNVEKGKLNGDEFTFVANNQVYTANVNGARMQGTSGATSWTATRQ